MGRRSLLAVLAALAVGVPASYALAGGASYAPHRTKDPCRLARPPASDQAEALQSVVLDGAARAACKLGISRESLVLALGDPATRRALGPEAPAALAEGLRGALADGVLEPGLAGLAGGLLDVVSVPEIVDEVLATTPPCRNLAFSKTATASAVVARVLVDAARRAACARAEPLSSYLAAVAPGEAPDPAVAAALRDGLRKSLDAARADEVIDPALAVVLDEGARALDPVRLVTLLRDGADACQPLVWQAPSGPDAISAQLALRTFVAAACDLKTPAAPLASAISERDPLAAVARAANVDEPRAEQAIRDGLATAADGLEKDKVLPAVGADALRSLSRVVPADRLLLAIQGADDPCQPLTWQKTNGVQQLAAELLLYGVAGAACETGLSVLVVAEALTGAAPPANLEEPLRHGMLAGLDAAEKAGDVGTIQGFALRQTLDNVPIYDAIGIIRDRL
ncbi:MAG: hypothetical protein QOE98_7 [Gaiellaceae bacterium]|nr:hypothetical protein [Gaiellaceae bacterium]